MAGVTVFAKAESRKIDKIIASVQWVSSLPYAKKAFAIDRIKRQLLDFIQREFPEAPADERREERRNRPHLRTGFRVYDLPGLENKVGFILQHRGIKDANIRRILFSLEKGSRGWYLRPQETDSEGNGVFTFTHGKRHEFAKGKRLHIPARKGGNYMKRTLDLAKDLVAKAKPEYFRKIKESIKKLETK